MIVVQKVDEGMSLEFVEFCKLLRDARRVRNPVPVDLMNFHDDIFVCSVGVLMFGKAFGCIAEAPYR